MNGRRRDGSGGSRPPLRGISVMIVVEAPSRLHFGLLRLPAGPWWPNHLGQECVPARRFGGVGLMIHSPGLSLRLRPAKDWSARGPSADRARAFARGFSENLKAKGAGIPGQPQNILIDRSAPEHV